MVSHSFGNTGRDSPVDTSSADTLGIYLNQISAVDLLSRKEEIAVARRIALTRARFRRAALSTPCLLRAIVALLEKVQTGTIRLDTRAIAHQACTIRIPAHALTTLGAPLSLDQPIDGNEDKRLGEILPDCREDDMAGDLDRQLLKSRIAHALHTLDYREREVIRLRYGLGDGHSHTLADVGKIFSVSRERVRQIEAGALRKLRQPRRSRRLSHFLERPITSPSTSAFHKPPESLSCVEPDRAE